MREHDLYKFIPVTLYHFSLSISLLWKFRGSQITGKLKEIKKKKTYKYVYTVYTHI